MYTSRTGLILGFHGTDESIVRAVVNGETELQASANKYDWLGNGIYFWDNSPSRALAWAEQLSRRPDSRITQPAVLGAILDLGYCLDLLDYRNLRLVKSGYLALQANLQARGEALPANFNTADLLQRELDCAVIETLHETMQEAGSKTFDSARGMFSEGKELYPNAGFREKDHIQICIRNIDCIKGYFLPLPRIIS
jgi:hypothetical protein